jgi:hypothetical protein
VLLNLFIHAQAIIAALSLIISLIGSTKLILFLLQTLINFVLIYSLFAKPPTIETSKILLPEIDKKLIF